MKTFALLALITLTSVYCQTIPSWTNAQAIAKAEDCENALQQPTCSGTYGNCASVFITYQNCSLCPYSMDSFNNFYTCVQRCGNSFLANTNANADPTSSSYVTGFNKCVAALNGSFLALSTFLLAVSFSLFF
ncbi:hypothetical protein ABPG74_013163 [Tetrahymena malaccensis]